MKPEVWLGLVAALAASGSCTEILGLDIIFVNDQPGGGGAGAQGAGGDGGAASSGIGGHGGVGGGDGCTVGLANASDSFAVGAGLGWCRFEPTPMESVVFVNTGVTLKAFESAWYDDSVGPFVYRNIRQSEGNFAVVAQVDVTDGVGAAVTTNRHGGGLMIRHPNPTPGVGEQWVKLTLTYTNGLGVKWYRKTGAGTTTPANNSMYGSFSVIAICRDDSLFSFFVYDKPNATWLPVGDTQSTPHMTLMDSDVLEVGVVSHVDIQVPGEVVTKARYIDFHPVDGSCLDVLPKPPRVE